jgi:hypothetical protein
MVLGPFPERKGPRLPRRNESLLSAKKKTQHIEENGNVMRRNDFVSVGLILMTGVAKGLTMVESQAEGTSAA